MPMTAGLPSPDTDRKPMPILSAMDSFAKDALLAWFRGEFAAANAIIDALCSHLVNISGGAGTEYEKVFAAIHRRRLNWIPVLQMQNYHSIADVHLELRNVAERKTTEAEETEVDATQKTGEQMVEKSEDGFEDGDDGLHSAEDKESPLSVITDSASAASRETHDADDAAAADKLCINHEDCSGRSAQIKLTKGFNAKEHVRGHVVNVVKGLKLYENLLSESELRKVTLLVDELRVAGQNGHLSGDTYISFNKQMKGNRKELVQFGIPIFDHIQDESERSGEIEPIPALLHDVIEHLIQWKLLPEHKKPNGSIVHYFDENEYSQPFLKPPHLEQPISTLVLSESAMAFGRTLVGDSDGNYKGPLMLSLPPGCLLVMRGNSGDLARHVLCPSPNKRVCITFYRVRSESHQRRVSPSASPVSAGMSPWLGSVTEMVPKWGVLRSPVVMLAPLRSVAMGPKGIPSGGTGVFLPWAVGSRSPKHLPPRAQRSRLLALPSPAPHSLDPDAGIDADRK